MLPPPPLTLWLHLNSSNGSKTMSNYAERELAQWLVCFPQLHIRKRGCFQSTAATFTVSRKHYIQNNIYSAYENINQELTTWKSVRRLKTSGILTQSRPCLPEAKFITLHLFPGKQKSSLCTQASRSHKDKDAHTHARTRTGAHTETPLAELLFNQNELQRTPPCQQMSICIVSSPGGTKTLECTHS